MTYAGVTNTGTSTNDYVAPDCNEAATDFTMTSPALPAVVIAGTYTDTITMTVTTQ